MLGRSREDSKDEHMHLSDAVLESVMVFRLAAGAVAEVVVPLALAKAGLVLLMYHSTVSFTVELGTRYSTVPGYGTYFHQRGSSRHLFQPCCPPPPRPAPDLYRARPIFYFRPVPSRPTRC